MARRKAPLLICTYYVQSMHVTPGEGYNDIICFYWVGLHTYSSAVPAKIQHALARVILQRRVRTENVYLVSQKLLIGILSACGTSV